MQTIKIYEKMIQNSKIDESKLLNKNYFYDVQIY